MQTPSNESICDKCQDVCKATSARCECGLFKENDMTERDGMTPVVEIDFETRSVVDIMKCGAGRYASDPSTKILCTCWAVDEGPIMGVSGEEPPEAIIEAAKKGWTFSAFNAMFEQLIWTYRWPHLPMPKFICTRALAASHGLPQNLDDACKALHIGTSKDPEGRRLINTYSVPRKDGIFNEVTEEDKKKFLKYCSKDVVLSRRLRQRLPKLPGSEPAFYAWTVKTNVRGVRIDTSLARNAERIAVELQRRSNKEMAVLTENKIFTTNQVDRIKNFLKEEDGIYLECLDKDAIDETLLLAGLSGRARRILELRRDFSQASVKKFARVCASVCPDGRVRDSLIYQGAGATGRWSSQGVQFQNLIRYTLKDQSNAFRAINAGDPDTFDMLFSQPMHALSACVRGIIIPEEGKMLAVSDYNAIEARVLAWQTGQEDSVAEYHQNIDKYIRMAELIYGVTGFTKDKNPKERFLGKTTVLGCGYQMGFIKFQATCEDYGIDLGEKTEYIERETKEGKVTRIYYAPLAKRAVETFRATNTAIVDFWYEIQRCVERCIRDGKPVEHRGLLITRERDFMYIRLLSGRRLAYYRPGIDNDGIYFYGMDSQTHQFGKKRLYGGRITENIIQATARDLLAHGIINIEKAGYPVVMTVHDETISEVDKKDAKKHLDIIGDIMCDTPAWAKGCPVKAEGFVCERYRKG